LVCAALARRYGGPTLRLPTFDRRDLVAVALVLLVVPAVTWVPYQHVRARVAEGEAYRAYFTADFVWAMTVTSELAKGEVPPINPFLNGEALHYYWMAHFLSGSVYRNVSGWGVTAEQVVLVNGIWFGLAFVAFFYALARMSGASPLFAALAVAVGFLANSYEGANRLLWIRQEGESFDSLRNINIDAVTRWYYQGMPVDGLQRLLLYQPHHLTGYVLALGALWVVGLAERADELAVAIWTGAFLGLAFLFSTFTALLVGAAVVALFGVRLLSQRSYSAIVVSGLLAGGLALIGVLLTRILVYTDPRAGTMIQLGLNPVAVRHWPLALLLSFGPLLIVGVVGLFRLRWARRDGAPAAMLVLVSFAFYFFVDVPDMEGVWVGWRSGHQLLIAFSVIGAAALTVVWQRRSWRVPLTVIALLAIVPAVPTAAIDVYNAQDIANRGRGPNFPWTLIITPEEREAVDWLRRATPPDAVVQFEPQMRGNAYWAYIPAFAERRMAAGLPGAMIPFKKYEDAVLSVRMGIFRAQNAKEAYTMYTMADYLGIDYIYVGDVERRFYRSLLDEMSGRPELFPTVFKNATVTILGVTHTR
jgi:hypothetical protein